jgi:hypothetical protein
MTPAETLNGVLYRMLVEDAPAPVHQYLPGSVDPPCIVVGRITRGADPDVPSVTRATAAVTAFGRVDRDADAQLELIRLGDYLFSRFWTPEPFEALSVLLDGDVEPTTTEVGGVLFPSETASIVAHFRYCP